MAGFTAAWKVPSTIPDFEWDSTKARFVPLRKDTAMEPVKKLRGREHFLSAFLACSPGWFPSAPSKVLPLPGYTKTRYILAPSELPFLGL